MNTTSTDTERAHHKKMMENPDLWPVWPVLPVKRHTNDSSWPETGVIMAVKDWMTTVCILNMFSIPSGTSVLEVRKMASKEYMYDSVDALLDDGWVVD
jgi:hypothetical protein